MNGRRGNRNIDNDDAGAPGEGLVRRWSRLKADRAAGSRVGEPDRVPPAPLTPAPPGAGGEPAEPELPRLDEIGADSDVSAFLSRAVRPELRRAALRRMFQSPKFNVRDALDDINVDYRSYLPLGDVMTADLRHRLAVEAERLAKAALARAVPADESDAAPASPAGTDDTRPPSAAAPADADNPTGGNTSRSG